MGDAQDGREGRRAAHRAIESSSDSEPLKKSSKTYINPRTLGVLESYDFTTFWGLSKALRMFLEGS